MGHLKKTKSSLALQILQAQETIGSQLKTKVLHGLAKLYTLSVDSSVKIQALLYEI